MNFVLLFVLTASHFSPFATIFWLLLLAKEMKCRFLALLRLVSFLKSEVPPIFIYSQWSDPPDKQKLQWHTSLLFSIDRENQSMLIT